MCIRDRCYSGFGNRADSGYRCYYNYCLVVAHCFHMVCRGDHYSYLSHRFFVYTGAVSYTHLDVYKRQVIICAIVLASGCGGKPFELWNFHHHSCVSLSYRLLFRLLLFFLDACLVLLIFIIIPFHRSEHRCLMFCNAFGIFLNHGGSDLSLFVLLLILRTLRSLRQRCLKLRFRFYDLKNVDSKTQIL